MWLVDTGNHIVSRCGSSTEWHTLIRHPLPHMSNQEVEFHHMWNLNSAKTKTGWNKVRMTCKVARSRFKYAWVDTCCNDKSSSAELTEAQPAEKCYVYLADLSPIPEGLRGTKLPKCRWCYRGWTLQELIASKQIEFYDKK
ncbi:hypothetical protein BDP55DRAFT_754142 [Colletotrichum godetiae]|uniref:Heterokaryon incompatibility domain-containing protein n=1 Tax=Colletotrichum godetiae TaxID=1209918 RepID=A0AAJ0ETB6_9PEZI|nr:uncharacterized protein BDP55DRAFT_754142 [Colletotrichum godetiae]KAK1671079.1 hypothetical protein BDP55DRAFT_754142 [Colletotrichum godetiae]